MSSQDGRSKVSPFSAMSKTVAEDASRRTASFAVDLLVVGNLIIQEMLDFCRGVQLPQNGLFLTIETEIMHHYFTPGEEEEELTAEISREDAKARRRIKKRRQLGSFVFFASSRLRVRSLRSLR